MIGLHKFSLKTFVFTIAALAICCAVTFRAQGGNILVVNVGKTLTTDTIPAKKDSSGNNIRKTPSADTSFPAGLRNAKDTLRNDTFSLKLSKDSLEAPVYYEAEDSAVVLAVEKQIILYGSTKTHYKDVALFAPKVLIDQERNTITAYNLRDSSGEVVERARFEQGENKFESDTIQYNFKTQKGLTKNTFTQQSEMFIQGEVIKKVSESTVFVKRGRFTTCDLDHPHFAFRANKLKIINNKVAVSGPMHPEFEDVPVPIYLPFGFYPLSKGRHSGLLAPQFTATENYGLGLEGLGYYKALNDYFDATFRANIYSYGGWRADLIPSYRVRYRYSGSFYLSLQNTKINFKGDPDYENSKTFMITWNHSVDQRARPGVTFSANVNAGSVKYNRYITNNALRNFQNQLSSSIAYSKVWKDKPFNLQLTANHNQNNATRLINLLLPSASFSVNTIYPFQRKEAVGAQKWYEKLGIGYNGTATNQISFYDTSFSVRKLLDTLQWGASHSVPVTLSLPPVGPILISPQFSYQEQWMMMKTFLSWNAAANKVDTVEQKGFYTARNMSFGVGLNTALFGTYNFKKSRVIAIRHTVRPNFGINYTPNLARNYFREVQVDANGRKLPYNVYNGNLFQGFSNQEFGGISFGIDNQLEMKKRSKKDTANGGEKKIRLIDGFGFNSGYNFLTSQFPLNDLIFYLRSTLFDKINLNMGANLTPYDVDDFGARVNKFVWRDGFKPGRITSANISMSTQFRSKPRDPSKKPEITTTNKNISNDPALMGDQQRLQDYMQRNPSEFVDFNVPYDLGLDFALSLTRSFDPVTKSFKNSVFSSINFRNSFSLTPKWNVSTNGYFDVNTKKLQAFTIAINREMHCWQMSIGVTPVGLQRYFNISISPKSSLLQNLKVNRTRVFNDF